MVHNVSDIDEINSPHPSLELFIIEQFRYTYLFKAKFCLSFIFVFEVVSDFIQAAQVCNVRVTPPLLGNKEKEPGFMVSVPFKVDWNRDYNSIS